jgi:hypothetical protein
VYFKKNGKTYVFSVVRDKIVCLICSKTVSATKEYNLCHHYEIYIKINLVFLKGG